MAVFVIVHGAWGGGWEWSSVAEILRSDGHHVFTPTLTGLGERAHLEPGRPIGLSTHIADVVSLFEFEQLQDVVLCAASYGGMPATGAADEVADRVRLLIYVDGLVPTDGKSALDLLPEGFANSVREGLRANGPGWRVPMPPKLFLALIPPGSVPEHARKAYLERVRDHPALALSEPICLSDAVDSLRKAFVHCTIKDALAGFGGDPVTAGADRARRENWTYCALPQPHDPQIFDPLGIAAALSKLSR
jgi:pimeloyl-ACP methyl ester carboxylesterase